MFDNFIIKNYLKKIKYILIIFTYFLMTNLKNNYMNIKKYLKI